LYLSIDRAAVAHEESVGKVSTGLSMPTGKDSRKKIIIKKLKVKYGYAPDDSTETDITALESA